MILFVTYPVLTIQSTVSAISSGVPSLPIGISARRQHSSCLAETQTIILFDSSSLLPGSIFVCSISAGAMPFTVIPFAAYVLASQCTRPWSADFADLDTTHQPSPLSEPYMASPLTHNAVR
jgi:hypothetical protein